MELLRNWIRPSALALLLPALLPAGTHAQLPVFGDVGGALARGGLHSEGMGLGVALGLGGRGALAPFAELNLAEWNRAVEAPFDSYAHAALGAGLRYDLEAGGPVRLVGRAGVSLGTLQVRWSETTYTGGGSGWWPSSSTRTVKERQPSVGGFAAVALMYRTSRDKHIGAGIRYGRAWVGESHRYHEERWHAGSFSQLLFGLAVEVRHGSTTTRP